MCPGAERSFLGLVENTPLSHLTSSEFDLLTTQVEVISHTSGNQGCAVGYQDINKRGGLGKRNPFCLRQHQRKSGSSSPRAAKLETSASERFWETTVHWLNVEGLPMTVFNPYTLIGIIIPFCWVLNWGNRGIKVKAHAQLTFIEVVIWARQLWSTCVVEYYPLDMPMVFLKCHLKYPWEIFTKQGLLAFHQRLR